MASEHKQVWAKVNAHVDEGVAPLVEALSRFRGVRTLESCQGNGNGASVWFVCGEDGKWRTIEFAEFLGPKLWQMACSCEARATVQWGTGTGLAPWATGVLEVAGDPDLIRSVARQLAKAVHEWNSTQGRGLP